MASAPVSHAPKSIPGGSPRDAGRGRRRTSASVSSVSSERGSGRLRPRSPALPAGPARGPESAAQPPSATILPARTPQSPKSAAHRGAHRAAPLHGRCSRGAGREPGAPGRQRRESAPLAAPVDEPGLGTPPSAIEDVPPSDARQVHRPARRRTRAEPGRPEAWPRPADETGRRTSRQSSRTRTLRSANTGSADTRERGGRGRRARLPSAPRSDIGSGASAAGAGARQAVSSGPSDVPIYQTGVPNIAISTQFQRRRDCNSVTCRNGLWVVRCTESEP